MSDDREELERLLALFFSANRMPCMSGDPRDRLSPMRRRDLSDAVTSILEAGFVRPDIEAIVIERLNARIAALTTLNTLLGEKVARYAQALDAQQGTPCEQIRHEQEVEALTARVTELETALTDAIDALANAEIALDNSSAMSRPDIRSAAVLERASTALTVKP